jgi:hypothetical protein
MEPTGKNQQEQAGGRGGGVPALTWVVLAAVVGLVVGVVLIFG